MFGGSAGSGRTTTSPIGTQDRSDAKKKAMKAQYATPRITSLGSS